MSALVWSERESNPAAPGWHDCWISAGLTMLVASGFDRFPLGVYTDAEREAAERSQSIFPPEVGGNHDASDVALRNRYGVSTHRLADGSWAGLRAALSAPGRAYQVAGSYARLRPDLRGWDPSFTGNHDVAVVTRGGGLVDWLDPLAPMRRPPVAVDVDTVLRYAFVPSDARSLGVGELGGVLVGYRVTVQAGVYRFYFIPGGSSTPSSSKLVRFSRASWAPASVGSDGYWQVNSGGLRAWYLIAGRSLLPFTAERITRRPGGALSYSPVDPAHGR